MRRTGSRKCRLWTPCRCVQIVVLLLLSCDNMSARGDERTVGQKKRRYRNFKRPETRRLAPSSAPQTPCGYYPSPVPWSYSVLRELTYGKRRLSDAIRASSLSLLHQFWSLAASNYHIIYNKEPLTSWGPISSERSFGNSVTHRVCSISGPFLPKYRSLSNPH